MVNKLEEQYNITDKYNPVDLKKLIYNKQELEIDSLNLEQLEKLIKFLQEKITILSTNIENILKFKIDYEEVNTALNTTLQVS